MTSLKGRKVAHARERENFPIDRFRQSSSEFVMATTSKASLDDAIVGVDPLQFIPPTQTSISDGNILHLITDQLILYV